MDLLGIGARKPAGNKDAGGFVGFVLLSEPVWDKARFEQDLLEDWGIDAAAPETERDGQDPDILLLERENLRLAVSFIAAPVPGGEAEHYAEANYLWPGAAETVKGHKAQILVAVLGDNAGLLDRGRLFTKAVASCLRQEHALGVYTDGAVFQPEFYRGFAKAMRKDGLPIPDWVWFGLYGDEKQAGLYTYGMKKFGRDEIEVYVERKKADLNEIRDFLLSIVSYVLEHDVTLNDGETIGFSPEQKLPITRSKGIALDGETLKIEYGQAE